jgi:hypothetical protein
LKLVLKLWIDVHELLETEPCSPMIRIRRNGRYTDDKQNEADCGENRENCFVHNAMGLAVRARLY